MGRPSKAAAVLTSEKKSHRTKTEINHRIQAEEELLTGKKLQEHAEIKENKAAHAEFLRISKLLKTIGKNDALYENAINTYCEYAGEIEELKHRKEAVLNDMDGLREARKSGSDELNAKEYYKLLETKENLVTKLERQIETKRKRRFDIEKEFGFTLAASLRAIPKAPKIENDPLKEILGGN